MTSDKWVSSGHSGFPTILIFDFFLCVFYFRFFVKYIFVFCNLHTLSIAYFIYSVVCGANVQNHFQLKVAKIVV